MKSSIQVKQLISLGLSNREIADKVCITESGVKYHITNILREYGCKSRAELIVALREERSKSISESNSSDQEENFELKSKE